MRSGCSSRQYTSYKLKNASSSQAVNDIHSQLRNLWFIKVDLIIKQEIDKQKTHTHTHTHTLTHTPTHTHPHTHTHTHTHTQCSMERDSLDNTMD